MILSTTGFSTRGAAIAIGVGVLVLAGWLTGNDIIKSVLPGLATMKVNSALGFVVAGGALLLLQLRVQDRRQRFAGMAMAMAAVLLSALTLVEYLVPLEFGLDTALMPASSITFDEPHPGRMSIATSLNFLLLGLALLVFGARRSWSWVGVWLLVLPELFISFTALLGYVYGVTSLYRVGAFSTMALHTAGTFMLLGLALLAADTRTGFMSVFVSDTAGGVLARNLLPLIPLLLLVLGWLRLHGEISGYYDMRFGVTLMVTLSVAVCVLIIARQATILYRMDRKRQSMEVEGKRLETRFRAVVESAPTAMVMVDARGRIVLLNAAVEKLFGTERRTLMGQTVDVLVPARFRAEHPRMRAQYVEAPATRPMGGGRDLFGLRSDGSEFPVEIGLSSLDTDEGRFVLAVIVDITERKRQEELQKSNLALEKSNKDLQRFAHVASHDLQTPLRSIIGFLQLLQSEYASGLDDRARDWIGRSIRATTSLQNSINDLLDYSRIDTEVRQFEQVSFRELVDNACLLLDSSIRGANAVITCDELPTLAGDRSQLARLMLNLLGNALKYHREEPRIHVSAEREGDAWLFAVRDNGIGIPERFHERIFQIFQRLHSQREFPGTGIGLAICRRVVERHGGSIWVESVPGQGSTFYFRIPEQEGGGP